jgi:hypothetical protein
MLIPTSDESSDQLQLMRTHFKLADTDPCKR